MTIKVRAVVLWTVATAAAIAIASAAIAQVGQQLTASGPSERSLVEAAVPTIPEPPPVTLASPDPAALTPSSDRSPRTEPVADEPEPDPEPSEEPDGEAIVEPAEGDAPAPEPSAPSATGRVERRGEASTSGPASPAVERTLTFEAVGGSAAIHHVDDTVELGWATPKPGFRAKVEGSPDRRELRVEFRSDGHRSRIKVWIEGGRLRDRVEEDDRD